MEKKTRKKRKPQGPSKGSFTAKLDVLEVGEALWLEADPEGARATMRRVNMPPERYPALMRHKRFSSSAYSAVPVGRMTEFAVTLVRIERIK